MRLYQGVDLVEVARLREAYERHEVFGRDIFTEEESAFCLRHRNPFPHFAARFAAKEACLKAFGVGLGGFGATGRMREVEVESAPSGKPSLRLHGSMERMGKRKRIRQATVTLSHTLDLAIAMVTLVGEEVSETEEDE